VFENFTFEQIANNRLQLKASIELVRMLAFQGVAFRGQDESVDSTNCENFLEILNLIVSYNEQIAEVIAKAPKNDSYTSPMIQKEILHIFSTKVKETICKEIGNAKFCIIVDEVRDESMKEQMAIILRFVDKDGFVREHFFGLVHVSNIAAVTLQNSIYFVFSQHKLRLKIFESKDMTAQVTCEVGGMGCKLWFQMIVDMPTTFIVSHIVCNWH
jgi:hypothetical protein